MSRLIILPFVPLVAILFGFSVAPASAQSSDEKLVVELNFRCMAWERTEPGLRYASGGAVREAKLPTDFLSPEYRYEGPPKLRFFREEPGVDGETVRRPVAAVALPEGLDEAILIFFPQEGTGGREAYRVLIVDAALETFPPGSYRVFNTSSYRIAGQMAETTFVLEPQSDRLVRPDAEPASNIPVQFAVDGEQGWQRKVSTAWFYRDSARSLVFLLRQGNRLNIRSVPQYEVAGETGNAANTGDAKN